MNGITENCCNTEMKWSSISEKYYTEKRDTNGYVDYIRVNTPNLTTIAFVLRSLIIQHSTFQNYIDFLKTSLMYSKETYWYHFHANVYKKYIPCDFLKCLDKLRKTVLNCDKPNTNFTEFDYETMVVFLEHLKSFSKTESIIQLIAVLPYLEITSVIINYSKSMFHVSHPLIQQINHNINRTLKKCNVGLTIYQDLQFSQLALNHDLSLEDVNSLSVWSEFDDGNNKDDTSKMSDLSDLSDLNDSSNFGNVKGFNGFNGFKSFCDLNNLNENCEIFYPNDTRQTDIRINQQQQLIKVDHFSSTTKTIPKKIPKKISKTTTNATVNTTANTTTNATTNTSNEKCVRKRLQDEIVKPTTNHLTNCPKKEQTNEDYRPMKKQKKKKKHVSECIDEAVCEITPVISMIHPFQLVHQIPLIIAKTVMWLLQQIHLFVVTFIDPITFSKKLTTKIIQGHLKKVKYISQELLVKILELLVDNDCSPIHWSYFVQNCYCRTLMLPDMKEFCHFYSHLFPLGYQFETADEFWSNVN